MLLAAEEAVEASLYETLVHCLRKQSDLRRIFEKYCSIADPFNVSLLSHQNFKKFARDTGLAAGDLASDAAVDLLFTKATNRLRGVTPRLNYQSFVAILARTIVERYPGLQPDSVAACVADFTAKHLAYAARLEALPSGEELLDKSCMAVLTKELGFLRKVCALVCAFPRPAFRCSHELCSCRFFVTTLTKAGA